VKWISVDDKLPADFERVDVWMSVMASPMSFGMSDAWRQPEVWRESGKWVHFDPSCAGNRELVGSYITHWMAIPKPPRKSK
jgi:hypothetical protein